MPVVGVSTGVRCPNRAALRISGLPFALLTIVADNAEPARLVNQVENLLVSQVSAEVYHVPLAEVVRALRVLVIRVILIRLLVIRVLNKQRPDRLIMPPLEMRPVVVRGQPVVRVTADQVFHGVPLHQEVNITVCHAFVLRCDGSLS